MPIREDYGDHRRENNKLVPAALTAYRHFNVVYRPSLLQSGDNSIKLLPVSGCDDPNRQTSYPSGPAASEPYTAACIPYLSQVFGMRHQGNRGRLYGTPHPTPSLECTCGFYAHYYPDTDFYEDDHWVVAEDADGLENVRIMVRAAVEMSGRVVAGDLGVRAERMKIKAIAVDWAKALIYAPVPAGQDNPRHDSWDRDRSWPEHRKLNQARDREVIRKIEALTQQVSLDWGLEWYPEASLMYAKYPQQDLSALGINAMTQAQYDERLRQREAERRRELERRVAEMDQTLKDFLKDVGAMVPSFSVAFDDTPIYGGEPKAKAVKKRKPKTIPGKFDAVIQAGRQRPAPPGTGIDRRKRKL